VFQQNTQITQEQTRIVNVTSVMDVTLRQTILCHHLAAASSSPQMLEQVMQSEWHIRHRGSQTILNNFQLAQSMFR